MIDNLARFCPLDDDLTYFLVCGDVSVGFIFLISFLHWARLLSPFFVIDVTPCSKRVTLLADYSLPDRS